MSAPITHLKQDPELKKAINKVGVIPSAPSEDIYFYLLRSIVSQQLSVKAAATIFKRFLNLFKDQYPNPQTLVELNDESLREVGVSRQKSSYLKAVADFHLSDNMTHAQLKSMSDEEIIKHLTQIKGVGKWTVQMLLMFPMNRADVFPIDDLGIVNGMKSMYGVTEENKKKLHATLTKIADQWKPYRTLACKYVWRNFD